MSTEDGFEFRRRAKGVVWVCDIVDSSKYLNDDEFVDNMEMYLPRVHWTAVTLVRAAGGEFIKWTGDGFLAWFEMELHRELERKVADVLMAAWHLTVLNNITRLGVPTPAAFRLRHGITLEQDALRSSITYPGGHRSLDLIGRSVVLAFRLAGIRANFPSVVVQGDIAQAQENGPFNAITFKHWHPTEADHLRYFKGETWGTNTLYVSAGSARPSNANLHFLERVKKTIEAATGRAPVDARAKAFALDFATKLQEGPAWASRAFEEYVQFLMHELLAGAENLVAAMENMPQA
jgi:class 3 adenylate cyclase